jgi:polyisoprenoid-binding protein YceI
MPEVARSTPQVMTDLTGTWTLDPSRTKITFATKAVWILTVRGTMRATEGSGTVDPDGHVTARLVVDASSIDTKNKKRDEHLRTADFFETEKYPSIVFDVTDVALGAPGQSRVKGTLSIHGVSRPLEFDAALRTENDGAVTLDAQTEIDRSEWGLTWTKMGAGLHNRVTLIATFVRRGL